MTLKINTAELLPIKLTRMVDGSVKGVTPSGTAAIWPDYYKTKPTRRNKRVMLDCAWWRAEWEQ